MYRSMTGVDVGASGASNAQVASTSTSYLNQPSTANGRFIRRTVNQPQPNGAANPNNGTALHNGVNDQQHLHRPLANTHHNKRKDDLAKIRESLMPFKHGTQEPSLAQRPPPNGLSNGFVGNQHQEAHHSLPSINQQPQTYSINNSGMRVSAPGNNQTNPSNNGPPLPQQVRDEMLRELMNMGFEQEPALLALKLANYRSLGLAVDILIRAESPSVYRSGHPQNDSNNNMVAASAISPNFGAASDSSRSDSPLDNRIRQGNNPSIWPQPQRTPSPLTQNTLVPGTVLPQTTNMNRNNNELPNMAMPGGMNIFLQPNTNANKVGSSNKAPAPPPPTSNPSSRLQQHASEQSGSQRSLRVQSSLGAHNILICGDEELTPSEQGSLSSLADPATNQSGIGYYSTNAPNGGLLSSNQDSNSTHTDYIHSLCNKVTRVLHMNPIDEQLQSSDTFSANIPNAALPSMPTVKRNSTASSTGSSEIVPLGDAIVTDELTVSDERIRCVSPLPNCVRDRLVTESFVSSVKPFKPEAFRFFMEQHIENVIKQFKERRTRLMQLEKELVNADFQPGLCENMRSILAQKESRYLRQKRQKLSEDMFETIQTIGVGAFGKVMLVRKQDTDSLYAMKQLNKRDVIKMNQVAHVKAERDILAEANSDWIVKLFYSFQDSNSLFFIMEYIPGGDMMSLLIRKEIFEEELARFFIAELICAIDYVHRLGFIHRDIKPDNILIDATGHLKLTDFGLCTGLRWTHDRRYYEHVPNNPNAHSREDSFDQLRENNPTVEHKLLNHRRHKRRKAKSLVGTSNYMAPEVLLGTGYTQLCDWWSVGVILYEMVVGCPPFYANTPGDTQEKVINWREYLQLQQPPGRPPLSEAVCDLILSLCCDQQDRLGVNGTFEIKDHRWFVGLPFDKIRHFRSPHVPSILYQTDTSNFDTFDEQQRPPVNKSGTPSAAGDTLRQSGKGNPAFFEFTFRHFFDTDANGGLVIRNSNNGGMGPDTHSGGHQTHGAHPTLAPVMEQQQSIMGQIPNAGFRINQNMERYPQPPGYTNHVGQGNHVQNQFLPASLSRNGQSNNYMTSNNHYVNVYNGEVQHETESSMYV